MDKSRFISILKKHQSKLVKNIFQQYRFKKYEDSCIVDTGETMILDDGTEVPLYELDLDGLSELEQKEIIDSSGRDWFENFDMEDLLNEMNDDE